MAAYLYIQLILFSHYLPITTGVQKYHFCCLSQISISYGQFTITGQPVIKNIVNIPHSQFSEEIDPTRQEFVHVGVCVLCFFFVQCQLTASCFVNFSLESIS